MALTKKQIENIGRNEGLVDRQLKDFVNFIRKRLPYEGSASYVAEWAQRFKDGVEWFRSDLKSQAILRKVNSLYYKKLLKAIKDEEKRFEKKRGFKDVSMGFYSFTLPRMSRERE